MLTPTLFDVAAIIGLSPLGETFDPTLPTNATFSFSRASLQNYIEDHHDQDFVEVFDEEHIAFLTLWLSYYVLSPDSLQIAKIYISLAIQIHKGRQVSLGKILLASLYHYLRLATLKLKYPLGASLYSKGPEFVRPYVAVATLVKRHIQIPVGLFGIKAHNVFEQGSTS